MESIAIKLVAAIMDHAPQRMVNANVILVINYVCIKFAFLDNNINNFYHRPTAKNQWIKHFGDHELCSRMMYLEPLRFR